MAPEQITAHASDARSDQFAWGVLAYELLAGQLPWGRDRMDITALLSAEMFTEPPPLSQFVPALAPALVAALNRVEGRHVIDAKLGCPVCGAAFFIRDEVAIFDDTAAFPPPDFR